MNEIQIKNLNEIQIKNEMEISEKISNIVKNILDKNSVPINGKKYVKANGWQAIAKFFNCKVIVKEIKKDETGYFSYAEMYDKDNNLISSSYGFCGFDEIETGTRKRKEFELVSLAQTRAIARCIRNSFSFLLAFLDKFEYTVLEDLPDDIKVEKKEVLENNTKENNKEKKQVLENNTSNWQNGQLEELVLDNKIMNNVQELINFIDTVNKEDAFKLAKVLKHLDSFKKATEKQKNLIQYKLNKKLNGNGNKEG